MSRFVYTAVVNLFVLGVLAVGAQAQDAVRAVGGSAVEPVLRLS